MHDVPGLGRIVVFMQLVPIIMACLLYFIYIIYYNEICE